MSTGNTLDLPDEISIANIGEWKEKFVEFVADTGPLVLNAEHLSRVDTSALQLMLALVKKAEAENKELSWDNPSAALKKTAVQLGLDQALGL